MKRRAFTLMEVLVSLGILALLMGVGLVNFHGGTRKAGVPSLAAELAAELQAAQSRAVGGHTFVALAFPSSGGGTCQSFSRWEGLSRAGYRKGRNFAKEFPNCSLFVGSWGVTSGSFSTDRPPTGLEIPGFQLSNWFSPRPVPTDHLLVFTPTGAVLSNDLPLYNGRYTLVVGNAIAASATTAPAGTATVSPRPPYFQLDAVENPCRVEVDPTGAVVIEAGLGPSTGVTLAATGAASAPALPLAPPASGTNSVPVVEGVQLSPGAPNLPSGVEGAISKDDYLKLTVEASDADGDSLTCLWTSSGGAFTSAAPTRMRWDQQKQRWVSTWTFRAHPDDPPLTHYDLHCEVRDPSGTLAVAAAGVTLTQTVEVRQKPFFVFTEYPHRPLYVCNEDGTDFSEVPIPGMQAAFVSISPDGQTIAFIDADYNTGQFHLWSVLKDGSQLRPLVDPARGASCCTYSNDGKSIVYAQSGRWKLMPACGEVDPTPGAPPTRTLATGAVTPAWNCPSFSIDDKKLVFTGRTAGGTQDGLYVYDLSNDTMVTVGPPLTRPPSGIMYSAVFSRNPAYPNQLLVSRQDTAGVRDLVLMNDDGTGIRNVPMVSGWFANPTFCRDGLGVLFDDGTGVARADLDFVTATLSNHQRLTPGLNTCTVRAW